MLKTPGRPRLFFFFYNLVLTLLAPVAVPYWLLRSRAKGQPRRGLHEKLGYLGGLTNQTPADSIWLHAVSVGEVLSAVPLLRRLRERFPASPLYVSASTAAGRKLAGQKLAGLADAVFAAPLEFPWCVARAFRALRPRLLIVFETEIWPNYFLQAERFGAEALLLNGRMSDRSAPRYARLRRFFGPVLRRAGAILTQSETDRQRFLAAGAPPERTRVGGNVKYDFDPPEAGVAADLQAFFHNAAPDPVVVAGSTREGEEALLAQAFRAAAAVHRRALFVVAPRHPQRFDEAATAFDGLPLVRRSKLDAAAPLDLPAVLLLDTLGELAGLYSFADVVFMGGSLNGWGGHNVLEPALAKRPRHRGAGDAELPADRRRSAGGRRTAASRLDGRVDRGSAAAAGRPRGAQNPWRKRLPSLPLEARRGGPRRRRSGKAVPARAPAQPAAAGAAACAGHPGNAVEPRRQTAALLLRKRPAQSAPPARARALYRQPDRGRGRQNPCRSLAGRTPCQSRRRRRRADPRLRA